jgi:hypothetical protein
LQIFLIEFSQKTDPLAILSAIHFTILGKKEKNYSSAKFVDIKMAAHNELISPYLTPSLKEGYYATVTCADPFPLASSIRITVGPKVNFVTYNTFPHIDSILGRTSFKYNRAKSRVDRSS